MARPLRQLGGRSQQIAGLIGSWVRCYRNCVYKHSGIRPFWRSEAPDANRFDRNSRGQGDQAGAPSRPARLLLRDLPRGDTARAGSRAAFVQENHSLSVARGVIRGLHFRSPRQARPSWCESALGRSSMSRWTSAAARRTTAGSCGRAERRRGQPAVRAGGVRARLLHARAEYRGVLQGQPLLLAGARLRGWPGTTGARAIAGRCRARRRCCPTRTDRTPVLAELPAYFRYVARADEASGARLRRARSGMSCAGVPGRPG